MAPDSMTATSLNVAVMAALSPSRPPSDKAGTSILTLSDLKPTRGPERPVFLYYTDVLEKDLENAAQLQTKGEIKSLLKQCMKIDEEAGFRSEILADMHYHNYTFCLSRDFLPVKTSTLLSIMKVVLEEAQSGRLDAQGEGGAFDVFKEQLLKHSVERPPRSVGIFTFNDVQAIMDHMHNSFFRHYRLYMYAFRTHCNFDFRVDDVAMGLAPALPRPLVLKPADKVDPKEQPELADIFRPSEAELAEAEARRLREQNPVPEDRAALIKRKVDDGVKKLKEKFEKQLEDLDAKYKVA